MIFHSNDAIHFLKKCMKEEDEASSTFWKKHHANLVFDDEKFIGLEMLGTSKKRTFINLLVYELLEKFFAGKNETLIRSEELAEFLEVSAKEHLFQAPKITQLYDRGFYEKLPYQVNQNAEQVIVEDTVN